MTIEIPLTQGKVALIDEEDLALVSVYKWHADWNPVFKGFYARTNITEPDGKQRALKMHRLVLPAGTKLVDHKNHDTLDNRRCNLRVCSSQQNMANSRPRAGKRFKGVFFVPTQVKCGNVYFSSKPWRALIRVNNRAINLGYFTTEEEAALAYNVAAMQHFGEFAFLNIIGDDQDAVGNTVATAARLMPH